MSSQLSKKNVQIIGAGIGCGAPDERTQEAADWLKDRGLEAILCSSGINAEFHSIVRTHSFENSLSSIEVNQDEIFNKLNALPTVAQFNQALAEEVQRVMKSKHFPLIVGGDHSCAVGTWSGIKSQLKGDLGLIWLDAHMDSHTSETTETGAVHGMPLASLLGFGDPRLTEILGPKGKLKPENVALIGIRSFEHGEEKLLRDLGVRIFLDSEVKSRGFQSCFNEAVVLASRNTEAFGITLDLDGFDPKYVPAVGTPVPGGFNPQDVLQAFSKLYLFDQFCGLEIVEYNPYKDLDWKTFYLICDLIESTILGQTAPFASNSDKMDSAVS